MTPVSDALPTPGPAPFPGPDAPARTHPATLLVGLAGLVPRLVRQVAVLAGVVAFAARDRLGLAIGLVVVAGLGLLIGDALRWWRTRWHVTDSALVLEQGLVSRSVRVIPFDRIQDLSLTRGPLARLLGLAAVNIDTGGGGGGGGGGAEGSQGADGTLDQLALGEAERLRDHVRAWRARRGLGQGGGEGGGGGAGAGATDTPLPDTPLLVMSPGRVLLAGLLAPSLALVAAAFGASQTIGEGLGINVMDPELWRDWLAARPELADAVMRHPALSAVAGAGVLALVGILAGLSRALLRYYGLVVARTATGLRRTAGLVTRTDTLTPRAAVSAARLADGPVRRRLGYRALTLHSLARRTNAAGKGRDGVLAPLATPEEVERILADTALAPPPEAAITHHAPPEAAITHHAPPKAAITHHAPPAAAVADRAPPPAFSAEDTDPGPDAGYARVARAVMLPDALASLVAGLVVTLIVMGQVAARAGDGLDRAALAAGVGALGPAALAGAVVLAAGLAATWLGWRHTGWRLTAGPRGVQLIVRRGWLSRTTSIAPAASIQAVTLTSTPLGALTGTTALRLAIPGGPDHAIPALDRPTAEALRDTLLRAARGARAR